MQPPAAAAFVLVPLLALPPTPSARALQDPPGLAFTRAERCALCHSEAPGATAMRDGSGTSVAPYELWRPTMMGSSARDPLWRAVLSAEVAALPQLREAIESKCLRCHAPVLAATPEGTLGARASLEELATDGQLSSIAREGVTCLVCHQVLSDVLGGMESFSGGARLSPERRAFGPHASPLAHPMRMHSGFTPAEGPHVLRAGLCGTCHTLFTPVRNATGEELGRLFPEQAPYLEWRSSAYSDEGTGPGPLAATCQDCHLPKTGADGRRLRTRIARNPRGGDFPPIREREPFGRHVLAGGNTLVPALLAAQAEDAAGGVPAAAYLAKADAAQEVLAQAASLRVHDVEPSQGRLRFAVEVLNLTGHKLPTGHPTRRAWLRVRVLDAAGAVLFESGGHDERGRLLGSDGRPAPQELAAGPQWPHTPRVSAPGEVQVYEAVMADAAGTATFRLLAGATWFKDDRVLPAGFAPGATDAPHVLPRGVEGDDDFAAGCDRVLFDLALDVRRGPLSIEAELLYQPLGARWLAELAAVDTPQVRQLLELLERVPPATERVARVVWREEG